MLAYQMVESNKLFLDIEFSIQNVILETIKKVFKLVEIEMYEVENLAGKERNLKDKKLFITNHEIYIIKKNERVGLGYKKKKNQNK
ncbi:hypothetical protein Hanom_Chr06g00524671 [Helianthus anomalus]